MFTTIDKTVIAGMLPLIVALVFAMFAQAGVPVVAELQAAVIALLTAAGVYIVPNKPTAGAGLP